MSDTDAPLIVTSIVYAVPATSARLTSLIDHGAAAGHVSEHDGLGGGIQHDELVLGSAVEVVDDSRARPRAPARGWW